MSSLLQSIFCRLNIIHLVMRGTTFYLHYLLQLFLTTVKFVFCTEIPCNCFTHTHSTINIPCVFKLLFSVHSSSCIFCRNIWSYMFLRLILWTRAGSYICHRSLFFTIDPQYLRIVVC